MRSSYHCECKFCGAKHDWESRWLPVEVLQAFANIWILFHALLHHPKELGKKNRLAYTAKQVLVSIIIILVFAVLGIHKDKGSKNIFIRAFLPHARSVEVLKKDDGSSLGKMHKDLISFFPKMRLTKSSRCAIMYSERGGEHG